MVMRARLLVSPRRDIAAGDEGGHADTLFVILSAVAAQALTSAADPNIFDGHSRDTALEASARRVGDHSANITAIEMPPGYDDAVERGTSRSPCGAVECSKHVAEGKRRRAVFKMTSRHAKSADAVCRF